MKVSIVTISYNQAYYLERAILSVIEQSYENIEYIVVDPGSTDGSLDIIKKFQSRISEIILEPDQGPADGLNKGFSKANGKILGFLNSDDILFPNTIDRVVRYFSSHPKTDVVSGHTFIINEFDKKIRKSYSEKFSSYMHAYGCSNLMQASTFFRAEVFKKTAGFNPFNRVAWDGELFVDMCLAGAKFSLVNEFWSGFRLHSESITSSKKLDHETKIYQKNIFKKIMGREMKIWDYPLMSMFRLVKHLRNPVALYERLSKGPIYGRSAGRDVVMRKSV